MHSRWDCGRNLNSSRRNWITEPPLQVRLLLSNAFLKVSRSRLSARLLISFFAQMLLIFTLQVATLDGFVGCRRSSWLCHHIFHSEFRMSRRTSYRIKSHRISESDSRRMILIFHRSHARTVLPCAAVRSLSTYRPTELLRFDDFHFLFSHSTLDVSRRESVDIVRRFADCVVVSSRG